MTNETAQARLQQLYNDFLPTEYDFTEYDTEDAKLDREALQMGIKALEQQPCEDCISRARVLNSLKGFEILHNHDELRTNLIYEIMNLPSVQLQQGHGEWIDNNCSICGYGVKEWNNTPYCPNCGAKMEVEE